MAATAGYYPPARWSERDGAALLGTEHHILKSLVERGFCEPARAWLTVYLAGEPIGECEVETYALTEAGWTKAGGRPAAPELDNCLAAFENVRVDSVVSAIRAYESAGIAPDFPHRLEPAPDCTLGQTPSTG